MENKEKNAVLRFLEKKNVIISFKRYGIDALSAMALGLFASLLIGTIITTIGQNIGNSTLDLATATNVSTLDYMAVKLVEIGGLCNLGDWLCHGDIHWVRFAGTTPGFIFPGSRWAGHQ